MTTEQPERERVTEAERWLKGRKWSIMYNHRLGRTWYEPSGNYGAFVYPTEHDPYSLIEALRYAMTHPCETSGDQVS